MMQSKKALAVAIEGEPSMCIACAQKLAETIRFVRLFWMLNKPTRVNASLLYGCCGKRMDNKRALAAAQVLTTQIEQRGKEE
jgi:hypothetical protein